MKKQKTHYCKDCLIQFNAPEDFEERMAFVCPQCKTNNWKLIPCGGPSVHGDWDDFRREVDATTGVNGGRYFPQLARFPGDKSAVVSSVKEAIERGKRRGMSAERG